MRPSTRLQDYPECVIEYWRKEYESGVTITKIAEEIGLPAKTVGVLINKQLSQKLPKHKTMNNIQNPSQLNTALKKLGTAQSKLAALRAARTSDEIAIRGKYDKPQADISREIDETANAVAAYIESLPESAPGYKQVLNTGTLSIKRNPAAIAVEDAKKALEWLKINAPGCVRTKEEIDKNALKGDLTFTASVPGLAVERAITLEILPLQGEKIQRKLGM